MLKSLLPFPLIIYWNIISSKHVRLYDTQNNVLRGVFPQKAAVLATCWADRTVAYVGGLETAVKRYSHYEREKKKQDTDIDQNRVEVESKAETVLGNHSKVIW